jgi:hypothetical protein
LMLSCRLIHGPSRTRLRGEAAGAATTLRRAYDNVNQAERSP